MVDAHLSLRIITIPTGDERSIPRMNRLLFCSKRILTYVMHLMEEASRGCFYMLIAVVNKIFCFNALNETLIKFL